MLLQTLQNPSKLTAVPAAIAACLLVASCTTATNLPELPAVSQQVLPAAPAPELGSALAPELVILSVEEENARKSTESTADGSVDYEIVDLSSIIIE